MPGLKKTIAFLVCIVPFIVFSQSLSYSREFAAAKNHVPIQIINSNANYFHVLRYNKRIHDFTIEKRSKTNFEIVSFSALNLDSVNAAWFDYEQLDYLFFEVNKTVFFVFEKVLNEKRFIYLKQIDSLGKASGFKELATIEKDQTCIDFRFKIKQVNSNELLVVGEHYYQNSTSKKVVLVYDLLKKENKYIVKLPLENPATGFSQAFEYMQSNLYYVLSANYFFKNRTVYTVNQVLLKPVFKTKLGYVTCFNLESKKITKASICESNPVEIKSIKLQIDTSLVYLMMQVVDENDQTDAQAYFLTQAFDKRLETQKYCRKTLMDSSIVDQLTFYDGAEKKQASEKTHTLLQSQGNNNFVYNVCERKDENYYKELLFWNVKKESGDVVVQKIIPRKTFFFDDRTRFKNIHEIRLVLTNEQTHVIVLENKSNLKINPNGYNFHRFKKQKYLWSSHVIDYQINNQGQASKKLLYKNGNFNLVPLKYQCNTTELIFYLNNGSKEKFATLIL